MNQTDSDTGGTKQYPKFKCMDCETVHDSTGRCDECGGRIREYLPMEAPVYQVNVGGFGPIWFGPDDYSGAFQHATGMRIAEVFGDPDEELIHGLADRQKDLEAEITLVDFDGVAEVPVADV